MADTLPAINFGFAELQSRITAFQDRFDNFIANSRQRVLEERNQFRISLAALEEEERRKKRDIEAIGKRTAEHQRMMAQQEQETTGLQQEISDLSQQRDQALSNRKKLQNSLAALRGEIGQRETAQHHHVREAEAQARHNTPELDFWHSALGLRIEAATPHSVDRLHFVFTKLDTRQPEQDASFDLDTSKPDYSVVRCTPKIEADILEQCVDMLNRNRELGPFLKRLRCAFLQT